MIRTHALIKRFGSITAVDGIDLDVRPGDIYGFLGANGSGKTTTLRIVLGLVLATSGEVELLGETMPRRGRDVLPRVGSLVEGPAAYGHLSGRANLALLDASGRDTAGRPAAPHRRRAGAGRAGRDRSAPGEGVLARHAPAPGLAAALMREPELLVLDEPTNGLDPQGIREIRELLLRAPRRRRDDLLV